MKKRRLALTVFSLSALLLAVGMSVVAWFSLAGSKSADVEKKNIASPPTISVLNNETNELDVLNLEGLHLPDPKCIVFCVTPSSKDLVSWYILQLAYTENMSEVIDLYTCEYLGCGSETDMQALIATRTDAESRSGQNGTDTNLPQPGDYVACAAKVTDTNASASDIFYYYAVGKKLTPKATASDLGYTATETDSAVAGENRVIYKRYWDGEGENCLYFDNRGSWTDALSNRARYEFYMLYIHWPEGEPEGLESKETDVVYISAKGVRRAIG